MRGQGQRRHGCPTASSAATIAAPAAGWRAAGRLGLGVGGLAVLVAAGHFLDDGLPALEVTLVLALLAAGTGGAAALLTLFAARLTGDHEAGWLSVALGWYGLVMIPTCMIGSFGPTPPETVLALRLLVGAGGVGLLLAAAIARVSLYRRRVGGVVLAAALAATAAALLGTAAPAAVTTAAFSSLPLGLALAWIGAAVAIAIRAARRADEGLWLLGAGLAALGVAHAVRLTTLGSSFADVAVTWGLLRLAAVALVLWGALRLALQALARVADEHEEELRLAGIRLARAAERDHELRNGLAGLAGATTLLGDDCADRARLGTVVASELRRLDDLLQNPPGASSRVVPSTSYAVAPVLDGLVTLRRSSGTELHLDVEPDLHAMGSPATLVQVVTNLIGNAERHAPASPVRIVATRRNDRIVVRIRDFGPGVAPDAVEEVFEPGVRDAAHGGTGLGLPVCRRLLAAEDSTITLRAAATGCVAVVDLPAAPLPTGEAAPSWRLQRTP